MQQIETLEPRRLLAVTPSGTYDFGEVNGQKNVKVVIEDADGTRSVFALAGGGTGHVLFNGFAGDVSLDLTTQSSNLTISAAGGDGRMLVSNISATAAVGKIIAPGVDIFGAVFLDGPVRVLTLGDIDHTHTILIGAGAAGDNATVTLRDVFDTVLSSAIPIKSLSARKWVVGDSASAGSITAPALGKLKIAGDFGANITASSLGNATVGGTWSGTTTISGNAGNLKMRQLRGSLTISGTTRSISTGDFLTVSSVASATGGSIHVASASRIKGLGETLITGPAGTTLFTSTADMYTPQELWRFDDLGSVRTYDQTVVEEGSSTTGQSIDTVRPAPEDVDGRSSFILDNVDTQSTNLEAWFQDAAGAYQTDVTSNTETDDGGVQHLIIDLGLLRIAPPVLTFRKTSADEKPITAILLLDADNISADLAGTAELSTTLVGHQLIHVPAGDFLAAKVVTVRKLHLVGPATSPDGSVNLTLDVLVKSTLWMVPQIGIVQETNQSTLQISAPGLGRQVSRSKDTRLLSAIT